MSTSTTDSAILDRLEDLISRVFRHLAARTGGETGLSLSQRLVLRALSQSRMQVSDVAATLGVTLSAATGLIDRMARAGLVTRERDRGDRRVVWVRLTQEGRQALAAVDEARRQAVAQAVSRLSSGEVEQLLTLLERVETGT
ncbi:MarR family winged helix-turn-helix transcriptional regulator [Caldinitratiruptor microaerophilus]|uniref:MarR family transcriptional regulator n=1 Tax=Caldinitratiruptor microaerophilus TaxID=671077 RepID=A0AA35CHU2_9FIRM|nr:MarR family transcriptional regulator [Caldinitratiruptor microaerophilus]BDG59280.1 MarR family transcriptional regulator [Caldinitratiruptor microaerophilus]